MDDEVIKISIAARTRANDLGHTLGEWQQGTHGTSQDKQITICSRCGAMAIVEQGVNGWVRSGSTQRLRCQQVLNKNKRARELRAQDKQEKHDPLCSEDVRAGDQTMSCDCDQSISYESILTKLREHREVLLQEQANLDTAIREIECLARIERGND